MTVANLWTDTQAGPASYPTGGFTVVTSLSTVVAFDVQVSVPSTALGRVHVQCTLNTPSAGQVTVKVLQDIYKLYSTGVPAGLPSGVTAPVTSGQTVAAEAAHTMDITHGHSVSAASTQMAGGSGLMTQAAASGVNASTHTHTVTITSAAFTSGAGSSHTHTWDSIYQHSHSIVETVTDVALVELANATDLSGCTLNYLGSSN